MFFYNDKFAWRSVDVPAGTAPPTSAHATAAPEGSLETGSMAWLVTFRNPLEIIRDEPTFLLCEIEMYMLALLTFLHAYRHGGRYLYDWCHSLFHHVAA